MEQEMGRDSTSWSWRGCDPDATWLSIAWKSHGIPGGQVPRHRGNFNHGHWKALKKKKNQRETNFWWGMGVGVGWGVGSARTSDMGRFFSKGIKIGRIP